MLCGTWTETRVACFTLDRLATGFICSKMLWHRLQKLNLSFVCVSLNIAYRGQMQFFNFEFK